MQCDDKTAKEACLCCGNFVTKPREHLTPVEAEFQMEVLGLIGYSRDDLLTKHRHQAEYQLPGLVEYLEQSVKH
jgi:hypothetical protein